MARRRHSASASTTTRTTARTSTAASTTAIRTVSVDGSADAALDAGINLVEQPTSTADPISSSWPRAMAGRRSSSGGGLPRTGRRDQIVLATKLYQPMGTGPNDRGLSAYHMRRACEESLRRLQTDHIDLYQMHHVDRGTPWEEVWQAMEQLVQQGKMTYVGSSNFAGWHIATAQAWPLSPVHGAHVRAEPLQPRRPHHRAGSHPGLRHLGIGLIAYSPLHAGVLTASGRPDTAPGSADPRIAGLRTS